MELGNKPDWDETKKRMSAWGAHEDSGKSAIGGDRREVWVKNGEPPRLPDKKEDWWLTSIICTPPRVTE